MRAQKNRVRGFDDATLAFRRPNPLAQAPRRALVIVEDSRDGVRAAKRVLAKAAAASDVAATAVKKTTCADSATYSAGGYNCAACV